MKIEDRQRLYYGSRRGVAAYRPTTDINELWPDIEPGLATPQRLGEVFRQIGKALLAEPFSPTLWEKLVRGLLRWL